MFHLMVLVDKGETGLVMFNKEKGEVQLLNDALMLSNKSTYISWASICTFSIILFTRHAVVFSFIALS